MSVLESSSTAQVECALTATHEAGHAVGCWLFGIPIESVDMRPSKSCYAEITHLTPFEDGERNDPARMAMMLMTLMGPAAEFKGRGGLNAWIEDARISGGYMGTGNDFDLIVESLTSMDLNEDEIGTRFWTLVERAEELIADDRIWKLIDQLAKQLCDSELGPDIWEGDSIEEIIWEFGDEFDLKKFPIDQLGGEWRERFTYRSDVRSFYLELQDRFRVMGLNVVVAAGEVEETEVRQ